MPQTVQHKRTTRPNLDGGRPAHPIVTAMEAHVGEIIAMTDDAAMIAHGAKTLAHIAHVSHRISVEMAERAERLRTTIIPEVQSCLGALELHYAPIAVTA